MELSMRGTINPKLVISFGMSERYIWATVAVAQFFCPRSTQRLGNRPISVRLFRHKWLKHLAKSKVSPGPPGFRAGTGASRCNDNYKSSVNSGVFARDTQMHIMPAWSRSAAESAASR